jgi:hypothetical protein
LSGGLNDTAEIDIFANPGGDASETTLMKHKICRALVITGMAISIPISSVATAQTTAPPAASPAPGGAPPVATPGGQSGTNVAPDARQKAVRERVQDARAACRDEAKAQGLTGPALTQHVQSCFAAKMPQDAKRMECRRQGMAKGMVQPALREYVQQCMAAKS